MKFENINYRFDKFSKGFLTTISLYVDEDLEKMLAIFGELKERYIKEFNLHYNIFKYDSKTVLKISIDHDSDETLEDIKNAIEQILSLNSVFYLIYHGKKPYYSFLCEFLLKF